MCTDACTREQQLTAVSSRRHSPIAKAPPCCIATRFGEIKARFPHSASTEKTRTRKRKGKRNQTASTLGRNGRDPTDGGFRITGHALCTKRHYSAHVWIFIRRSSSRSTSSAATFTHNCTGQEFLLKISTLIKRTPLIRFAHCTLKCFEIAAIVLPAHSWFTSFARIICIARRLA
jgi:hypothetical protein